MQNMVLAQLWSHDVLEYLQPLKRKQIPVVWGSYTFAAHLTLCCYEIVTNETVWIFGDTFTKSITLPSAVYYVSALLCLHVYHSVGCVMTACNYIIATNRFLWAFSFCTTIKITYY